MCYFLVHRALLVTWYITVSSLVLGSSLVYAASDPLTRDLPTLEVMPNATYQWIAEKMALNGLPMSIREFEYKGPKEDVKRYYITRWRTKGHGKTTEEQLGFDTILAYELRDYYYSVQYYEKDGVVKGKLTVSEVPNSRNFRKQKTSFPMPPSSKLVKKMEYLDYGRRSETLTIESRRSVNSAASYIENQLLSGGWVESMPPVESSSSKVHYKQIHFQRSNEQMQVTLYPQAGKSNNMTEILVNWVNK